MDQLDKNGQCPLVHAALRGHIEVVKFLIQCDWSVSQQQSPQSQQQAAFTKSHAIQQALIAAASMGYTEVRGGGPGGTGLTVATGDLAGLLYKLLLNFFHQQRAAHFHLVCRSLIKNQLPKMLLRSRKRKTN